VYLVVDFIV